MHWGTKMTNERPDDTQTEALARFFEDARAHAPVLRPELRRSIQQQAIQPRQPARPAPKASRISRWWQWRTAWSLPGLAAGALGALGAFWIGVSLPMPVLAIDLPVWLEAPMTYVDLLSVHLIGLDDPLLLEF